MRNFNKFFVILLLFAAQTFAQSEFENTMVFDEIAGSPDATLEDVSWIEGHWRGEAFGGIVEEIWSPPLGNSMMCAFKLVVNNKVKFYEIVAIIEVENSLIIKLKHFSGNLTGWEEKDETVDFRLVEVTENKAYFDGFTFEKISENEMNIYVVVENNGKKEEMKFVYSRFTNN